MPEHDTIQAYLETAGEQIRWGRARQIVIPELRQHLEDQRDAFLAEDREDAERLAVEEMGDPVSVGAELDRIHRPKPQWGLLALTVAFALAGAVLRVWLTAVWISPFWGTMPGPSMWEPWRPRLWRGVFRPMWEAWPSTPAMWSSASRWFTPAGCIPAEKRAGGAWDWRWRVWFLWRWPAG